MIGILLIGALLGLFQGIGQRWLHQRFRSSTWLQLYFSRSLLLGWISWGVIIFLWLSQTALDKHRWVYPPVIIGLLGLLWFMFKEFWLGWAFVWRWKQKDGQQVQWQGQLLKINQLHNFYLLLSNEVQQFEIPYSSAQNLVAQLGDNKGKGKKYHRSSFLLAEQFIDKHGIEQEMRNVLLQSPWSIPSKLPQITTKASKDGLLVTLEIPASTQQKAQEMASLVKSIYEAN